MQIAITDVRIGDVLLIAGKGSLPRLVRLIEGVDFDHVAIVAPPNLEDVDYGVHTNNDRTQELWICDVGFRGGRWIPISAYEEQIESIQVRRHRLPIGDSVPRALGIAASTPKYDWHRLGFLVLSGVPRWAGALPNPHSTEGIRFARSLLSLFEQVAIADEPTSLKKGLCTDLIVGAFDGYAPQLGNPYLGLNLTPPEQHGLLWWEKGMCVLQEFLVEFCKTAGSDQEDARNCGLANLTDPHGVIRQLLDVVLKQRWVVTPADIARTPSLQDVGVVDLGSLVEHRGDPARR